MIWHQYFVFPVKQPPFCTGGGHSRPVPAHLCALLLPDRFSSATVTRVLYTPTGASIIALGSNGVHKVWNWEMKETQSIAKAMRQAPCDLWRPNFETEMINELRENGDRARAWFSLDKTGTFLLSASGGEVSVYSMNSLKKLSLGIAFPYPPAATCVAFSNKEYNTIAVGMDDSSILIYSFIFNEIKCKLSGHEKSITGLAFSKILNVLVSCGADAQLCVWSVVGWEKMASAVLQTGGCAGVLFHSDETRLVAFNEREMSLYGVQHLDRLSQWTPQGTHITDVTLSVDGHSAFACCNNGKVHIFLYTRALGLIPTCWINPTAYLAPHSVSGGVFPRAIAAHPSEANQFALGLSDGSVVVVEPLESDGKWHDFAHSASQP